VNTAVVLLTSKQLALGSISFKQIPQLSLPCRYGTAPLWSPESSLRLSDFRRRSETSSTGIYALPACQLATTLLASQLWHVAFA
jgi:hypothetical protein